QVDPDIKEAFTKQVSAIGGGAEVGEGQPTLAAPKELSPQEKLTKFEAAGLGPEATQDPRIVKLQEEAKLAEQRGYQEKTQQAGFEQQEKIQQAGFEQQEKMATKSDTAAERRARIMAEAQRQIREEKKSSGLEGRPLPAGSATELGDTQSAIKQLDNMVKTTGKVDLQFGPTDILRGLNPYDTSAKGVKQAAAATKQIIGKGLEGGVLRKEDEKKYQAIIPLLGDTREVLQIKYTQLREMITEKYNGQRFGLEAAGFEVSKFGDIPTSTIDITKKEKPTAFRTDEGGEMQKVPQISTDDEFDKLAPGTQFRDPEGNLRIKPNE
ncbi:MAG TPA: hypothetical protein VMW25_00210, partial [Clostridia bacterium]|nr:hypothetical protein [Clostridia bacterium]